VGHGKNLRMMRTTTLGRATRHEGWKLQHTQSGGMVAPGG